jgi:hypothetical protein
MSLQPAAFAFACCAYRRAIWPIRLRSFSRRLTLNHRKKELSNG